MISPVQFLAKFVLASAIVFMLWVPLSRAYFAFLSLESNAAFRLLGHSARLEVDSRGPHILYLDIFPPHEFKQDIRIPILQGISIHFNLIVIVALFAATPRMSYRTKMKGIAVGAAVLSLLHAAHIYFISYLFIWDYIDWRRWPAEISTGDVQHLIRNVERSFPRTARPYIVGLHEYWNHFLRESAPLLIWLYFAYPYLAGGERLPPEGPETGRRRRKAGRRRRPA